MTREALAEAQEKALAALMAALEDHTVQAEHWHAVQDAVAALDAYDQEHA